MNYTTVIDFWFSEIKPESWFKKDDSFDRMLCERFGALHAQAIRCELFPWRQEPMGRLAEIIVLDQFSRNIYRDRANAFASDPVALALAQEAIDQGIDRRFDVDHKLFLYLPYMHSESPAIHEIAVELFSQPGMKRHLEFEHKHKAIIDRFGRYPHRNKALGRESTAEEIKFLSQPNSSF